jgi:hypothetical protein
MHIKHTLPYHNCIYNHLPEGELLVSKRVEDIKFKNSNINLENAHFVGLCCIIGRGVRHGYCLSPILFSWCNEYGIRKAFEGFGVFKIGGQVICTVK